MKNVILITFLLSFYGVEAQNNGFKPYLKREKDGNYVQYEKLKYRLNESVLTVKLKPSAKLPKNIKIIHKSKVGYIDIAVPKNKTIEDFHSELTNSGLFDWVDYNSYGEFLFTPNDENTYRGGVPLQAISQLDLFQAWNLETGANTDVVVGLLDSDFNWEHPDLGKGPDNFQNVHLNSGEDAWDDENNPDTGNGIDDDGNGLIDDWKGWNYVDGPNGSNDTRSADGITTTDHGTRVAGIFAAKSNNLIGIPGIAGGNNGPGVKVLPYHIGTKETGISTAILAQALIQAVDMGVKIINMSFRSGSTEATELAIQYAVDHDVLLIASAGHVDDGPPLTYIPYPALNPNVIAVGGVNIHGIKRSNSNSGTALDISAPYNAFSTGTFVDNNGNVTQYAGVSGTSGSAAHVTGVAALMFTVNPNLSIDDCKHGLFSTTTKNDAIAFEDTEGRDHGTWHNSVGYGVVNAYAAVSFAKYGFVLEVPDCDNITLSGPDFLCDTDQPFSINNPSGTSVSWSVSPASLFAVDSGSESTFVTRASSSSSRGMGTITASLTGECGQISFDKVMWIGKPEELGSINGASSVAQNAWEFYDVDPVDGANSYNWVIPSGWSHHYTSDTDSEEVLLITGSQSGYVRARANNNCGSTLYRSKYVTVSSGGGCSGPVCFSVFPNPASAEMNIESSPNSIYLSQTTNTESANGKSDDVTSDFNIALYNTAQMPVYRSKMKQSLKINTRRLKKGMYFLKIRSKNDVVYERTILIE